jgi:ABC-type dipeptide/oligopeptide/nickel transport system ATPase subunit
MIFQDPYASLNPTSGSVIRAIAEVDDELAVR